MTPDAAVSIGEVAMFSGAGGIGKSTITAALAHAGASAAAAGSDYYSACGLRVTAGAVVMVSYEDSPQRLAQRLAWINSTIPPRLYLSPAPAPLWQAAADRGGQSEPGADWRRLWDDVRRVDARLVVIDPVSAALADVDTSETGPVRAFLRSLTAEATPDPDSGWEGCAVLLVGHSTKSARNALAAGQDPNAGVVAGSAAWYDGSRAVLTLFDSLQAAVPVMAMVKCNYGSRGWGAELKSRMNSRGEWRGLELATMLTKKEVEHHSTPPPKPRKPRTAGADKVTPAAKPEDAGDDETVFDSILTEQKKL